MYVCSDACCRGRKRIGTDKRYRCLSAERSWLLRKCRFVLRLLLVFLAVCVSGILGGSVIRAAGEQAVIVSLVLDRREVAAGEVLSVSVEFSSFPNLAEFSSLRIEYDSAVFAFEGAREHSDFVSRITLSSAEREGVVTLHGSALEVTSNVTPEDAQKVLAGEEPQDDGSSDVSFFSGSPVSVAVLEFRVLQSAPTVESRIRIRDAGIYTDFHALPVLSGAGPDVGVAVKGILSQEAGLQSLEVCQTGSLAQAGLPFPETVVALSPSFAEDVYAYSVVVPRFVSGLSVVAGVLHEGASAEVVGADHLSLGENEVVVRVTAEDKVSVTEYRLKVIRQTRYGEGLQIADNTGRIYELADIPDGFEVPGHFAWGLVSLGEQTFAAFPGVGMESFLVFVMGDSGSPELYLHVHATGELHKYEKNTLLVSGNRLFFYADPVDREVPEKFFKSSLFYEGETITIYRHTSETSYLLYLENENHQADFYFFDAGTGTVFPYEDIVYENNYLVPFVVVGAFAGMEFAVLAILIYQTRPSRGRRSKRKTGV